MFISSKYNILLTFQNFHNIFKHLRRARVLLVSKNTANQTVHNHITTIHLFYHHTYFSHHNMIAPIIMESLQLPISNLHLCKT